MWKNSTFLYFKEVLKLRKELFYFAFEPYLKIMFSAPAENYHRATRSQER
jgi:hypothetical protein